MRFLIPLDVNQFGMINQHFYFSDTDKIKIFVLDEADEMLSRGFKDQIYDIFRKLPTTVQVMAKKLFNISFPI